MKERIFNIEYDTVIIAPGCTNQTFGTPGVSEYAQFVKTVKDAMAIRARLQELVEMSGVPGVTEQEQRDLLHVIVVGGGPTGVEISAEMTDLIHNGLSKLYPGLQDKFLIAIYGVAPHILSVFDQKLAEHALASFRNSHVDVMTSSHITKVEPAQMFTKEDGPIAFGMLIWATGNKQVPLIDALKVTRSSRLPRVVTNDLLHPLDPDGKPISSAYALGDAADVKDGELPTTAEVACQKAAYLAKVLNSGKASPFVYSQRAMVAYTGGHDGVVAGKYNWTGPGAWLAWRAKNLSWARSWKNKGLITMNWGMDHVFGSETGYA